MNPCAVPVEPADLCGDGRWISQHNHHLAETKEREPDVLLIGDSIVHHLKYRPVWSDLYEPLHCLNFGIPGDCTQNVLWRIEHGEMDNINPRVVVVLVGTNNINDSAEQVSDGIVEVVKASRAKLPEAYIVVIDILPRGQYPNVLREKNTKVNELVRQKLVGMDKVENVDSSKGLLQPDGSISYHDMPDFLHLSDNGYRKSFEPLYELLLQLLNENDDDFTLPSE